MPIHNLPIRNKKNGDPYTFLGLANPKPSDVDGGRLAIYTNQHGALFYRPVPDFARAFEWHNGLPIDASFL